MYYLLASLAGVLAGIGSGLLGMGGGAILVPVLLFVFSLPIKEAIGTSLCIIVLTAISAIIVHWKEKQVNLKLAIIMALTGVIGAQLGSYLNEIIPDNIIKFIFTVVVIIFGFKMWIGTNNGKEETSTTNTSNIKFNKSLALILGLIAGTASGLLGIGGALIMVPVMHIFLHIPMNICVGTSLFIVFFNSLSGVVGYIARGDANLKLAIFIAVGSVLAAPFGAKLSVKISREKLRKIFAVVLVLAGIAILFKKA
ncbi:MAG: sulfite exporter TauE/SafE family protein [bacterium]|nr:sulfite exporter TauE/SafE family protein [bacterium]